MSMQGGYDLSVGTSERGTVSKTLQLPGIKHLLVAFGGPAGLEDCMTRDPSYAEVDQDASKLFDLWLNTCPQQGSRTIRTEEALLISMSCLQSALPDRSM